MIFLSLFLIAAEINFSSSVDRTTVGLGEAFTLNVTASGENLGNVPTPQLPELPDFNVIGRSSSQSTNISLINGKMTQQVTINFIYTLSPKKIGKLMIGPCTIKYQDKTYETQPVQIEVIKGTTQPAPSHPSQTAPSPPSGSLEGNLMVVSTINRRTVFVGEQVNVDYALYTRYNLGNVNLDKVPSFSGFWSEKIFDASRIDYQRKTYGGKAYNAALLKKVALFPITAGELTIDPMVLKVEVVRPPRDFFDFFGTTEDVRVESRVLKLTVQPLPEEGKPEEFCGGVGNFTISAKLDRDSSANGEPINLIVKITGTGNVRLVEKPKLPSLPNLRVLEPEVVDKIQTSGEVVKGTKEFHFPIIPQADGEHIIPEITIAFFDPRAKTYKTVSTEKQRFTASGAAVAGEVVEAGGMKVLGTDIRYIKPDAKALRTETPIGYGWFYALYFFSILVIVAAVWHRTRQDRMTIDRAYARKARSNKLVKKRLKQAEVFLTKNNVKEFYSALAKSVLGYAGDRFNIDTQVLTKEHILEKLSERGVNQEMINDLREILEECDTGCYSPGPSAGRDCRDIMQKAKGLLNRL